jgi:hypothetical protein
MQGIIVSILAQQLKYSKPYITGFLIGGVGVGFISYGFGMMRGEKRYTDKMNLYIKTINEEKIREISAIKDRIIK